MSGHIICIIKTIAVGWKIGIWFLEEERDELFAAVLETLWGGGGEQRASFHITRKLKLTFRSFVTNDVPVAALQQSKYY